MFWVVLIFKYYLCQTVSEPFKKSSRIVGYSDGDYSEYLYIFMPHQHLVRQIHTNLLKKEINYS